MKRIISTYVPFMLFAASIALFVNEVGAIRRSASMPVALRGRGSALSRLGRMRRAVSSARGMNNIHGTRVFSPASTRSRSRLTAVGQADVVTELAPRASILSFIDRSLKEGGTGAPSLGLSPRVKARLRYLAHRVRSRGERNVPTLTDLPVYEPQSPLGGIGQFESILRGDSVYNR